MNHENSIQVIDNFWKK